MNNPLENQSTKKTAGSSRTPQFYRTRKALLLLPLPVLFLVTVGFANFHRKPSDQASAQLPNSGINTNLPNAKFDKHEKPGDKMSFYQQAKQDSDKARSAAGSALVQQFGFKQNQAIKPDSVTSRLPAVTIHGNPLTTSYTDPNVSRINQKLADINRQISQPQPGPASLPGTTANKPVQDRVFTEQVNKLETMMKAMNSSQGNDPEMQQLSKMLEQLQAIQHPELVKATLQSDSAVKSNPFKAISAMIDGKQKIRQGGAVKLRLNDTITIKGQVIPKGTAIYGTAHMTNQRLLIDIKNIRLGVSIIPTDLTVYYTDGMPGVPAPEAELDEAAGSGADNALQSMQFLSMDQSLATQAAAGGITAAKGLFSKKVRKVKVHLKNGEHVLLRNNQLH